MVRLCPVRMCRFEDLCRRRSSVCLRNLAGICTVSILPGTILGLLEETLNPKPQALSLSPKP